MAETEKNRVDSVIIMSPIGQFITSPVTFLHSVDPRIKLVWLLTLVVLPARANIVQKAIKDSAKRNDLVTAKELAREIVSSRRTVKRLYENKAQMNSISMHLGESLGNDQKLCLVLMMRKKLKKLELGLCPDHKNLICHPKTIVFGKYC